MWNRIVVFTLAVGLAVVLFSDIPSWSQPKGLGGNAIEYVEPPKGSTIRYVRIDPGGLHYEYLAPPNFKDNPIHIYFEQKDPNPRNPKPDVYVWADVIHWNDATQSATATGRIVVDSEEYRIETSYVEYNHITRQIYCPKRVVVILKNPNGKHSRMEGESAILRLDDDGIKEAKIDKLIKSIYYIDRDKNPVRDAPKSKSGDKEGSSTPDLPGPSGLSGPAD